MGKEVTGASYRVSLLCLSTNWQPDVDDWRSSASLNCIAICTLVPSPPSRLIHWTLYPFAPFLSSTHSLRTLTVNWTLAACQWAGANLNLRWDLNAFTLPGRQWAVCVCQRSCSTRSLTHWLTRWARLHFPGPEGTLVVMSGNRSLLNWLPWTTAVPRTDAKPVWASKFHRGLSTVICLCVDQCTSVSSPKCSLW